MGNRRDACGDRSVLCLDSVNVDVLVVTPGFCKMLTMVAYL